MLFLLVIGFFFFKQKTAYEMRISDWSSDVCSSDLAAARGHGELGWWLVGDGAERVRRRGVARAAQRRHPVAAPPIMVREYGPRVRGQGRRRDRPVLEPATERLGAQR